MIMDLITECRDKFPACNKLTDKELSDIISFLQETTLNHEEHNGVDSILRKNILDKQAQLNSIQVDDIKIRRNYIKNLIEQTNPGKGFPSITTELLQELFVKYDYYFLGNLISDVASYIKKDHSSASISFQVSGRMEKTAGMVMGTMYNPVFKISKPVLESITPDMWGSTSKYKPLESGGIKIENRLHALMLIFEHELIHLIIKMFLYEEADCHGSIYRSLNSKFFGHTLYSHSLIPILKDQVISTNVVSKDFTLDSQIIFLNKTGEQVHGKIIKLNPKNAIVLSMDNCKYSVPYGIIRKSC